MDVDRLIKERPELFDYQDIPPEAPQAYRAQIVGIAPQWLKRLLAKSKR